PAHDRRPHGRGRPRRSAGRRGAAAAPAQRSRMTTPRPLDASSVSAPLTMFRLAATPFEYAFPAARTALVVIDMQRDFIEPGGFGASLGNDVGLLAPAIAPIAALLAAWRQRAWPIVHTREAHRADLADCPPAKRLRGSPTLRIGDPGPMGRVLIAGEPGAEIIPALAPKTGEIVVDKPGKGMVWSTRPHEILQARGVTHLIFTGVTTEVCVQTSMREAND